MEIIKIDITGIAEVRWTQ